MHELEIEALTENFPCVLAFVGEHLQAVGCSPAVKMKIDIAVEEIFVNIAHYAYYPEVGKAIVHVEILPDPLAVHITFIDRGIPFNPLAKADPDVTLSSAQRQIGGLGIFLVKKNMDDIRYEYVNGSNFLTIIKKF